MAATKTVDFFRNLIVLETFLCINRSYLIRDQLLKTICNFIYFCVFVSIISVIFYDHFSDDKISYSLFAFQMLFTLELLGLTVSARFTKHYTALEKLDLKFGLDDDYVKDISSKANIATITTAASIIIDFCGMILLTAKPGSLMIFCLGAAAHDAELSFISLFINVINIRMSKLVKANAFHGSSVYRHILIATSYFNEGFQFGIQLMWFVTLLTTIIYGFIIVILNTNEDSLIVYYIVWREFKLIYSLWLVCLASYQTECICNRLQFHLTAKVALCNKIEKPSKSLQTLYRWHASVLFQQPRFTTSQNIPISLGIPVVMLDVSINYLLLVIQFYTAYK